MRDVALTVNGTRHELAVEPRDLLVHVLRERLSLTGTNVGCDTSSCGACTVLLDGESVKSCTVLAVQADGAEVTTIEGPRHKRGAPSRPAGVPRPSRPAVRLLHAGHGDGGGLADRARRGNRPRRDPAGPGREPLPLHGLPQHRRGGCLGGRERVMSATETRHIGSALKRKEDDPLLRGRGTYVDNIEPPRHGLHGRRPQPVCAREDRRYRHVGREGVRGCRRRLHRRRPARRLEGGHAVRLAGDRGHEEPRALPARRRRGALPGRRRRGRDRRHARARRRRGRARRGRLRAARGPRRRRRRGEGRRAARARGARHERLLRLEARDGHLRRRRRRDREAHLRPAAADPECDRATRRRRAAGARRRRHALVGDADPAHPARCSPRRRSACPRRSCA